MKLRHSKVKQLAQTHTAGKQENLGFKSCSQDVNTSAELQSLGQDCIVQGPWKVTMVTVPFHVILTMSQ